MRYRTLATAAILFSVFTGSTIARADEHEGGLGGATAAPVSNVPGTIAALNYADDGVTVNGLLLTGNVLLLFYKQVCGGIGALGNPKDSVTYSGVSLKYASGFETVHVTSYTDGKISYPPPAPPKPSAYGPTTGTIGQLNYSEWGTINGFAFTTSDKNNPVVFVHIGTPSADLVTALTSPTPPVMVTGMLEQAPQCTQNGVSEVDANSLSIGGKLFSVTQKGTPGAFTRPR